MKRIGAWFRKWWWTVLLGVAVVVTAFILIFWKRSQPTTDTSFSAKAREKIVDAEVDAKVERMKVETESTEKRAQLDAIGKIQDGVERRRQLAEYLDELL